MNLRDLRYLVAVVDHEHFGRAAQACHVSQPTLSAQIKKLEEFLEVQLIERTQRSVRVTDIGRQIASRARLICHEADELVEVARAAADPFAGDIRLAAIPTMAPYLFPKVLQNFRTTWPKLRLKLFEEKTADAVLALREGRIDAAFMAHPVPDAKLESMVLFEEKFVAAVPEDFPVPKRGRITLANLKAGDLLLLEEGHCLRDQALDVCARINLAEAGEFRATSLETLRNMVAAGAGVTLLPELATEGPLGQSAGVRIHRFKDPEPSRTVVLAWRANAARAQTIEALGDAVRGLMGGARKSVQK